MHLLWQDLKYGVRLLWKAPVFASVALVALALGMGATTAIFSVVDAVLLKPLPFQDPGKVLVIWEKNPAQNRYKLFVSPINYFEWQKNSRTMELAAIHDVRINLTGGPNGYIEPEELKCERATATLFRVLGVQPIVGRAFSDEEDRPGRNFVALLSYSLWQRRFGGDPAIVGKSIRLRNQVYTVNGVMPQDFFVMEPAIDIWVPLGLTEASSIQLGRLLTVIARRRDALDRVAAEMDTIGAQLEQNMPALNKGWRPSIFVLQDELVGGVRRSLWVLFGAVGCLLLMACVNVANLLLSRGTSRRREIALRGALGARRSRIVVQLLSESLLLSIGGGVLGLLLAAGLIRALAASVSADIPRLANATVDWRLFAFAFAISLLTGLVFGAIPAVQIAGANLSTALNEGGRGGTIGRRGRAVRNGLVISEVALAVVVLIGAGLLVRSFIRLRSIDLGFQPAGVLTMRVPLSGGLNSPTPRRLAFVRQLCASVSALPGVRAASITSGLPLTGLQQLAGTPFWVEGMPAPPDSQRPTALLRSITPAYFQAIGIPLVAGRAFTAADDAQARPMAIVNQTLARRFWPTGTALGHHVLFDEPSKTVAEIVGVVGDVKSESVQREDWPTIYTPFVQIPMASLIMTVRAAGSPLALAPAIQREVRNLDANQPVADVRTMEEVVDNTVSGARFNMRLLAAFALIAFVLAAVGIYGVISYDVSERMNEIGIRMALGAQPADVLRLVLGQGARMAGLGIAAGLALSFALTRLMSTMLFGIQATDTYTFAGISVLLALVALVASYLPSRRAMALNPVSALRHE
jgi:putative ABC transport system permease protein